MEDLDTKVMEVCGTKVCHGRNELHFGKAVPIAKPAIGSGKWEWENTHSEHGTHDDWFDGRN